MVSLVDGIQNSYLWGRDLVWINPLAEDPVRPTLIEQDDWGHNYCNPSHNTEGVVGAGGVEDVEPWATCGDVWHHIWIEASEQGDDNRCCGNC